MRQKVQGKKIWVTICVDSRKSWRCAGVASKSLQGSVSENLHHTHRRPTPVPRGLYGNFTCVLIVFRLAKYLKFRIEQCNYSVAGFSCLSPRKMKKKMLDTDYFTDEAWFHLDGYINSPKCRIGSTKNSHTLRRSPYVHKEWWTAYVVSQKLNCSNITEDHSWQWRTPEYHNPVRFNVGRGWTLFLLQQSGATSYTMDFFKECFDSRLISKHSWLSRSPHLACIDFFLWSHLEGQVCKRTHWSLSKWRPTSTLTMNKLRVHCYVHHAGVWASIDAWGNFKTFVFTKDDLLKNFFISFLSTLLN